MSRGDRSSAPERRIEHAGPEQLADALDAKEARARDVLEGESHSTVGYGELLGVASYRPGRYEPRERRPCLLAVASIRAAVGPAALGVDDPAPGNDGRDDLCDPREARVLVASADIEGLVVDRLSPPGRKCPRVLIALRNCRCRVSTPAQEVILKADPDASPRWCRRRWRSSRFSEV